MHAMQKFMCLGALAFNSSCAKNVMLYANIKFFVWPNNKGR